MTTFLDGPAEGTVLALRRAPIFLRVVVDYKGEVDALDDPEDIPKAREKISVYILADRPTWMHLKAQKRSGSGFFACAEYRHYDDPPDEQIRSTPAWRCWVDDRREYVPEKLLEKRDGQFGAI